MHWKEQEIELLKQLNTQNLTTDEIATKLDRSVVIVRKKIKELGIPKLHKKCIINDRKWANEISQITNLYINQHLSVDQIHHKLGIGVARIKKELKANNFEIRSNRYRFISPETINKIIHLYTNENKTIDEISYIINKGWEFVKNILKKNNVLFRSVKEARRKQIPEETKRKVLELYEKERSQRYVFKTLNLPEHIVREILEENNIKLITPSEIFSKINLTKLSEENELEIYRQYNDGNGKVNLSKTFHIGRNRFDEIIKKHGGKLRTIGISGKPTISTRSRGYSGIYDGKSFKSLNELTFMIYLNKHQFYWDGAENKKFFITYKYQDKQRLYYPDFILENKYLIEIKPKEFWKEEQIINKQKAAIEFCKNNNLIYKIIDVQANKNLIKKEYKNGNIKFNNRRKETKGYLKFMNYLNS